MVPGRPQEHSSALGEPRASEGGESRCPDSKSSQRPHGEDIAANIQGCFLTEPQEKVWQLPRAWTSNPGEGSASRLRGPGPWRPSLTCCKGCGNSVLGRRGSTQHSGLTLVGSTDVSPLPPLCFITSAGQPLRPLSSWQQGEMYPSGSLLHSPPAPTLQCWGDGPLTSSQEPGTHHLWSTAGLRSRLCHCFVHYPLHPLTPAEMLHQGCCCCC